MARVVGVCRNCGRRAAVTLWRCADNMQGCPGVPVCRICPGTCTYEKCRGETD